MSGDVEAMAGRLENGTTPGTDLRWTVTPIHREAAAMLRDLQAEIERLERNLQGRDSFIVERGMWPDFLDAITAGGSNG